MSDNNLVVFIQGNRSIINEECYIDGYELIDDQWKKDILGLVA